MKLKVGIYIVDFNNGNKNIMNVYKIENGIYHYTWRRSYEIDWIESEITFREFNIVRKTWSKIKLRPITEEEMLEYL